MSFLRRLLRRDDDVGDIDAPAIPRANGPARGVAAVHPAEQGPRGLTRYMPTDELAELLPWHDLSHRGPTLLRPGDESGDDPRALAGMAELVVLLAGELAHRDSLGGRGTMVPPAARLAIGGAGLHHEVVPTKAMVRDGGDLEVLRLRWQLRDLAECDPDAPEALRRPGTAPRVRLGDAPEVQRQGRSRIRRLVGPAGAALGGVGDVAVTLIDIASGATLDLPVTPGDALAVAVLAGNVLIGEDLVEVGAPAFVELTGGEPRLMIATRLQDDSEAMVLLLGHNPAPGQQVAERRGDIAAADQVALSLLTEASRTRRWGVLPRWPER